MCIFCDISSNLSEQSNLIKEGKHVFIIPDKHPVTEGHSLVITKEHYQDFSSCSDEALKEAVILAKEYSKQLQKENPKIQGFNFVSNQGSKAKQVIFHFHLHIIPRY
ncbi:HIT family hydrolase [Mycoplasma ovis str. Michigan]|uniref:HIT family hydrolase n=1 Tax=Mycoplasma ovis str. Michigan TaxID=1415773 RepID=A0ABM5P0H8_9MOLU|nr:HIT family protein [Mycoplasma ovis]AHC39917.1 HIT family hydrolase [Mycoplasma ovis str. Michigan]